MGPATGDGARTSRWDIVVGSGSAAMLTRGLQKFLFGVNLLKASSFLTVSEVLRCV
jgi:hypothetical protein